MPAKTEKQAKFMRAVAHSPEFAKKVGVPMSVGKEFSSKEPKMARTKKMAMGGMGSMGNAGGAMRGLDRAAAMSGRTMPTAGVGMRPAGMKKGGAVGATKMGAVKTAAPSINGVATKGKTKGKQIVMAGAKGMKRGGKCG